MLVRCRALLRHLRPASGCSLLVAQRLFCKALPCLVCGPASEDPSLHRMSSTEQLAALTARRKRAQVRDGGLPARQQPRRAAAGRRRARRGVPAGRAVPHVRAGGRGAAVPRRPGAPAL